MAIGEIISTSMKKLEETEPFLQQRAVRVCHISLSLKTGGLERLLVGLAAHAPTNGCSMDFIALTEEGRFAEEIRRTGSQVQTLGLTNRWTMVRRLRDLLRTGKYDVVHTHNTYPHLYGTLAARLAKIPIVISTRHGQRAGHGWKSRVLYRMASHWADQIVAVSEDAANLCVQSDRIPHRKVSRIWNGIDVADFSYRIPSQDPVAVTVGRLVPEKGLIHLLDAISIASKMCPALKLKIVGDGPMRSELECLANKLGIQKTVDFQGEQRDVPSTLMDCAFYISSSLTEGLSLTLLEAMACGLPVIATRVGGNPEIVEEGKSGLLVDSANPTAMAAAIVTLAKQPDSWSAMGLSARQRVVDHFDIRQMVARYASLYRDLVKASRL